MILLNKNELFYFIYEAYQKNMHLLCKIQDIISEITNIKAIHNKQKYLYFSLKIHKICKEKNKYLEFLQTKFRIEKELFDKITYEIF